jgi:hypothetical protein
MSTHILHRGQLWEIYERGCYDSRKAVEKEIRSLTKRIAGAKLELDTKESDEPIVDGDWQIYHTVAARLRRGKELGHCLGASYSSGGPGCPYIAVGTGEWTWGFNLNPFSLDQVKGINNLPYDGGLTYKATQIAVTWAHAASWRCSDLGQLEYDLREMNDQLQYLRQEEVRLAYISGRLTPGVVLELERPTEWTYAAPGLTETSEALREWLTVALELRANIEWVAEVRSRPFFQRWHDRGRRPNTCTLDHYDEELSNASAWVRSETDCPF